MFVVVGGGARHTATAIGKQKQRICTRTKAKNRLGKIGSISKHGYERIISFFDIYNNILGIKSLFRAIGTERIFCLRYLCFSYRFLVK